MIMVLESGGASWGGVPGACHSELLTTKSVCTDVSIRKSIDVVAPVPGAAEEYSPISI